MTKYPGEDVNVSDSVLNSTLLSERSNLIAAVPCFSLFSLDEIKQLADKMVDVYYEPGVVVVHQDEIVDSIYLIVEGQVEIGKEGVIEHCKKVEPIAVLGKGAAIGLSETNLFSITGLRTATVRAITNLHLLRLSLNDFDQFLRAHPARQQKMQETTEKVLYMNFIKRATPFTHLTDEAIEKLAQTIGKKTYAAHEIIFRQGDMGDNCYLLVSGEVELVITQSDGKERILMKLDALELLGAPALLMGVPRTATARTTKPSTLLSLSAEQLNHLMQNEAQVKKEILAIMMERQRPVKKPNVAIYQHTNADGELIITLKETVHHNYYRLSSGGLFIWQRLDGLHSLYDITMDFFKEFQQFSPQSICNLIVQLAHAGLVELPMIELINDQKKVALWSRGFIMLKQMMEIKVALKNTDQKITQWYNSWVHYLFTWPVQVCCFLLFVGGIAAFIDLSMQAAVSLKQIHHLGMVLVYLVLASLLAVPLHELAHAFTTKYFGREVNQFGLGWFWLAPIAFADTSDMWLCNAKWPRIMVNFAGVYLNVILAGFAAILGYLSSNHHLTVFLWLYAAVSYYEVVINLNPIQEFDGYYVLMDMLDKPNLRESSIFWLVKDFSRSLKSPRLLFIKHKAEAIYWIATILYLVLITYLAYLLQMYVFQYLFPDAFSSGFKNAMKWCTPLLVVVLSSVGVIATVNGSLTKKN